LRFGKPDSLKEVHVVIDDSRSANGSEEMPTIRETNEVARVLTADEYFKVIRKKDTRPAFWKFEDIKSKLEELGESPLIEAERRFVTTVNSDTEELAGCTPFTFIGWQLIHPGEHVPPHRHNSFAIYLILQGEGYTVVEGEKYYWKKGDLLSCPSWHYHEHFAEGEEDTIMYVVQDMPMLAAQRSWFWEEPLGQDNIRQMVLEKSARSWSVTRKDVPEVVEAPTSAT
jgi:gentisate 1,2-dioxygenase